MKIKQIVSEYGLLEDRGKSRRLGQNFIYDKQILRKIVKAAEPLDFCDVVEIGPGPGGLTMMIQESLGSGKLFAIEKDKSLKNLHSDIFNNVEFIYEDSLNINPNSLTQNDIIIIANLPYNVGTKLLVNWLLDLGRIKKMVLMFQSEVADRICAAVGTKQYGRLGVISQLLCKTERLFSVSSKVFFPQPKVESAVVRLTRSYENEPVRTDSLQKLITCAFQSRRKTIYSALRKNYESSDIDSLLSACNVKKTDRPENISPVTYMKMSEILHC